MPSWTLALCDEQGNELAELADASGVRYSALRNRAAEVTAALDLEDEAAVQAIDVLRNGLPRLKAWRDGVLRFYGWWSPSRLVADETEQSALTLIFRDPFERAEHSPIEDGDLVHSATDAGQIGWQLIDGRQVADAAALVPILGLAEGAIVATVNRDRTYDPGKFVGEAVRQLTEVDGGFDFEVVPSDALGVDYLGTFNVHASLGGDRSGVVFFQYGDGTLSNVLAVEQQLGYPVNDTAAFGEGGTSESDSDADSLGRFGRFRQNISASDGTAGSATLSALAAGALRPEPVQVVGFSPDPDKAPQPWDDYWLGDTVSLRADHGALQIDATPRVNGVSIALDVNGVEQTHDLTIEGGT